MDNLNVLYKCIEYNCKNQFTAHRYYFMARICMVALRNGRLDMAKAMNEKLYKAVIMNKEIDDVTLTFRNFLGLTETTPVMEAPFSTLITRERVDLFNVFCLWLSRTKKMIVNH